MSDYARAEPLLDEALAIRKKMVGENHPDYAATLSSLASLYYSKGDYARAEPLYERALAIRKQTLGEEHRDYASSLNSLANLHYSMNDYARAEPLYLQVLAIRKKVLGERHPEYASSLNNLASLYQAMGDYARAEPLYLQSAALWRKAYGGDENPEKLNHPSYATSLNNLANLYQGQGESAKAEPLYRQALEIRKQVLGPQHPDYSLSLNSLANLYYCAAITPTPSRCSRKRCRSASRCWGRIIPIAACLSNLARLYENRGEFALADPLALEVLEITERHLELTSNVQSERQQLLMNQAVRSYLDTYLSISAETAPPADQVHGEVLRWKGAVWARQQSLRHWRQALADDPKLSDAEKQHSLDALSELETASRQLATLSRATPSPERAEQYRQQIADLSGKIESLQRELAQLSADFRTALARGQTDSAAIVGCLPAGTALVDLIEILALLPLTRFAGQGGLAAAVGGLRAAARSAGGPTGAGLGDGDPRRGGFVARAFRPRASRSRQRNPGRGRSGRRAAADGLGAAGSRWARPRRYSSLPTGAQPIALGGCRGANRIRICWKRASRLRSCRCRGCCPSCWRPTPGRSTRRRIRRWPWWATSIMERRRGKRPPRPLRGPNRWRCGQCPARGRRRSPGPSSTPRGWKSWPCKIRSPMPIRTSAANRSARTKPPSSGCAIWPPSAATCTSPRTAILPTACSRDHRRRVAADVRNLHPGLLSGLVLAGANQPVDPEHDDGILTALEVEELDLSGMELATLSACQTGLENRSAARGPWASSGPSRLPCPHGGGQLVAGRGQGGPAIDDRLLRKPVAKEAAQDRSPPPGPAVDAAKRHPPRIGGRG